MFRLLDNSPASHPFILLPAYDPIMEYYARMAVARASAFSPSARIRRLVGIRPGRSWRLAAGPRATRRTQQRRSWQPYEGSTRRGRATMSYPMPPAISAGRPIGCPV